MLKGIERACAVAQDPSLSAARHASRAAHPSVGDGHRLFHTACGFVYPLAVRQLLAIAVRLVVVVDWFSRPSLFHRVSIAMGAAFCVEAHEEALRKYGRPEIFNSDQGSQFTREAFTAVLLDQEIDFSMDGNGT